MPGLFVEMGILLTRTSSMAGHKELMPIILTTQETEIRRTEVRSNSSTDLSWKKPSQKKCWWSACLESMKP
jgi:hypothetical protein